MSTPTHGQPYARVDLIPTPKSTLSPSQWISIWLPWLSWEVLFLGSGPWRECHRRWRGGGAAAGQRLPFCSQIPDEGIFKLFKEPKNRLKRIDSSSLCSMHCTENQIYVLTEMNLRGLFPNSYIHVSVRDLYIPRICLPIWLQQNRRTVPGNV